MTKQYDNTNSGALFVNDRKEKDSQPDFNGSINVDGKDYWIKGWKKESGNGTKFLSLAVNPKEEAKKTAPKTTKKSDDDDPF